MEFVGETLRAALEALSAAAPQWLSALVTADWVRRYGARIDSYRFAKGENVRQEWAEQVGRDGFTILEAAFAPGSPGWLREIPAVQVLRRAWVEQYHRDGEGVHWREGKDLPPGRCRLSSPYDPDARYSIKRGSGWCGYKTHLSETCELDAPHLITQVITTDATVADTDVTETVHQGLAARELLPAEHDVDAGYVTAAHIVTAQDRYGIELVGPSGRTPATTTIRASTSRRARSPSTGRPARSPVPNARPAPAGLASARAAELLARVHFTAQDCGSCPVREKCTKAANGKWGRSLTLLPQDQQEALETRRREQLTDEWQKRYNIRAGVEGTISQAVRRTQIRRTRFTGLPKTHLGHIFAATAINIIRLDAWLTETPLGPTRTSHLVSCTGNGDSKSVYCFHVASGSACCRGRIVRRGACRAVALGGWRGASPPR
ncbi:transposase [Streptomyces chiangmaiensis]